MDQEIGRRLRELRTRTGLSQRQLARQAGVANATISQIEAGKLNPTVSMLKRVLDGIPVNLSEFFGDEFERDQVLTEASTTCSLGLKSPCQLGFVDQLGLDQEFAEF